MPARAAWRRSARLAPSLHVTVSVHTGAVSAALASRATPRVISTARTTLDHRRVGRAPSPTATRSVASHSVLTGLAARYQLRAAARTSAARPGRGPEMIAGRALTARAVIAGAGIGAVLVGPELLPRPEDRLLGLGHRHRVDPRLRHLLLAPRRLRATARENNITQTVSSAVAAMPAAAGLLGAIPALALDESPAIRRSRSLRSALALGILGVVFAVSCCASASSSTSSLPFPTGTAVARRDSRHVRVEP